MRRLASTVLALLVVAPVAACSVPSTEGAFGGGAPESAALNELPRGSEDCTLVNVVASSEKAALLSEVATEFNSLPAEGETCARVQVYTKASGGAMDSLAAGWEGETIPRPDVWTPASTSWLRLLSQRSSENDMPSPAPLDAPSIAQTPLVIAMPRPMAESLGWPQTPLGWSDILNLSQDPAGWGSMGHPEWGPFRLGKTNPNLSTSGLNATVGTYFAATGLSSDLSSANVAAPEVRDYVAKIESSAVHYGDTTLTFLTNMDKASQEGRGLTYVSAVTVEEKSVLDYNSGNPTGDPALAGQGQKPSVPLAAIYPKEGTLVSDNPYAVLEGVSPEKTVVAEDFLTLLQSGSVQERFQEAGFRSFEGDPGSVLSTQNGLVADAPITLAPPSPQVLDEIVSSWKELRKPARVLLVVDVSGSMESGDKIVLAKNAILGSLDQFGPQDQLGLAAFSDEYEVVLPVAPFTENESTYRSQVENLQIGGGTALYAASAEGIQEIQSLPSENTIDAVVVLSDGENTNPGRLEDVIDALGSSELEPVRLFTIGFGSGADMATLEEMSEASGATEYNAVDVADIDETMVKVFSNF